jgi:hypothetical protein
MQALKEMDLGIEVVVAGISAAVLLAAAALAPNSGSAPVGVHPAAQFRTQMDLSVTPAAPARLGAIQPAFVLAERT